MTPGPAPATLVPSTADSEGTIPIMLRHRLAAVAVLACVGATAACGSGAPASPTAGPSSAAPESSTKVSAALARQLSDAHAATARSATNLAAAQHDGYMIITPMMPGMGFHYLNPGIQGFDATKPAILVYVRQGKQAQLVALEWVFPEKPATAPLEGATYGSFPAACHFKDGTFKPTAAEKDCPTKSPDTSSPFNFWHPDLVTLHVWLWYHNPAGIYHGTNPLVEPFTS
jgi:hypothetical protein